MTGSFVSYLLIYVLGMTTVLSIIGLIAITRWYGESKNKGHKEETEETEETTVIKKTA